jgi:hypothetical protein
VLPEPRRRFDVTVGAENPGPVPTDPEELLQVVIGQLTVQVVTDVYRERTDQRGGVGVVLEPLDARTEVG